MSLNPSRVFPANILCPECTSPLFLLTCQPVIASSSIKDGPRQVPVDKAGANNWVTFLIGNLKKTEFSNHDTQQLLLGLASPPAMSMTTDLKSNSLPGISHNIGLLL